MLNIITYINLILALLYLYSLYNFKVVHKKCDCITDIEKVHLFTCMILLIFYIVLVLLRISYGGQVTIQELNFRKIWDMIMIISCNIYLFGLGNGDKHGQRN